MADGGGARWERKLREHAQLTEASARLCTHLATALPEACSAAQRQVQSLHLRPQQVPPQVIEELVAIRLGAAAGWRQGGAGVSPAHHNRLPLVPQAGEQRQRRRQLVWAPGLQDEREPRLKGA